MSLNLMNGVILLFNNYAMKHSDNCEIFLKFADLKSRAGQ